MADVAVGETLMNAALDKRCADDFMANAVAVSPALPVMYSSMTPWREKVGPTDATEEAMLEVTDVPRQDSSRLSCQITMTEELDGLVLHIPE